LPETNATYVDPADVASIRDGIARAFAPKPRKSTSWVDVARATLEVYRESRDPRRRRRPRPQAHRRRDVRDQPAA